MDLFLNNKFLFIFISAESETTFGISKDFGNQNFILYMLKFMGIEIIHASFQIDWTKILGFFRKKFGFSFFSRHPFTYSAVIYTSFDCGTTFGFSTGFGCLRVRRSYYTVLKFCTEISGMEAAQFAPAYVNRTAKLALLSLIHI